MLGRLLLSRLLPALLALPVLTVAGPAGAHSWYPQRCCNEIDCYKVVRMQRLPDGSLDVLAGHIPVIVPKDFPAEPSLDHDAHVCVYRDMLGRYRPLCVFLPAEA